MKQSRLEYSEKMYEMMYDDQFKTDVIKVLKARVPIVRLDTKDERRMHCFFEHFCRIKGYNLFTWNCLDGLVNETKGNLYEGTNHQGQIEDVTNIHDVLKFVLENGQTYDREEFKKKGIRGNVFLFSELENHMNDPIVIRYLKKIYETYAVNTVFFPSTTALKTSNLDSIVTWVSVPNPSDAEYEDVYDGMLEMLKNSDHQEITKRVIADKDILLEKVQGMTLEQSQIALAIQCITYHDEMKLIVEVEDDSPDFWSSLSQLKKHLFKDNT